MAESLWTLLRQALQGIRALIDRVRRLKFKRNTTSVLLTAAPASKPKITVSRFSPLGARASSGFQSSNNAWLQDKERFLSRPTLARSNTRLQHRVVERQTGMIINPIPSRPEICIEDWSSPEIPLSDLQDPTSSTASSGTGSTTDPAGKTSGAPPLSIAEEDLSGEKCADVGPAEVSGVPVLSISPNLVKSPPLRAEKIKLTFEPIQRIPNAHSAVRDFFYDPPSYPAPAAMVPVPLFTNSPSLESSGFSKDDNTRLSLLPYPDLFDFAMYDARASQESSTGLRISLSPVDVTPTTDSPATFGPATISYRDRYRNSAYSRLHGLCTPAKTRPMSAKIVASSDRVNPRPRKRLGELPLASISFNTPTRTSHTSTPPALKMQDSLSEYSPTSSGDWNIVSLDDISTRLRDACSDLSRCVWTEEEFLRIISP